MTTTPTSNDLVFRSASQLLEALGDRTISSRELLDACVHQIERHNAVINAVVTLDIERAKGAALAADNARVAGKETRVVGIANDDQGRDRNSGYPFNWRFCELRDHVPAIDAPAVARLRNAGAIIIGKTNLPEFSSDSQSYNELFGTTANPWDISKTAGGSSGGAAAAVATGMTPLELGTDILGSIRIPSSFCGVYGLKPSYGVVPQRGYLRNASGGTTADIPVNAFGPIARFPEDLAIALDVLTAMNSKLLPAPKGLLSQFRIGYWFDDPTCPVDGEVNDALHAAINQLSRNGVRIESSHPEISFDEAVDVLFSIVPVRKGADALHDKSVRNDAETMQRLLMDKWSAWFEQFDALLCSVAPTTAFTHDHERDRSKRTTIVNGVAYPYLNGVLWTGLIGVAHLPSVAMPAGRTPSGLPVGMQVVTALHTDRKAIEISRLMSKIIGGFERPPL